MGRDPEYLEFIRQFAATEADPPTLTIEEERAAAVDELAGVEAPPVALVVDFEAGGVPARLYHPAPGSTRPGLVYFHGGGFYLGSVAAYEPVLRVLAHATGCAMVSVDYRLAPEHPFPAGVRDAIAATADIAGRTGDLCIDPARIGVAGDSAGANLAAVVARHQRSLVLQVLVYGVFDLVHAPAEVEDPDGLRFHREPYAVLRDRYLAGADPRDPDVSPLLADDLAGVAPAIVVSAEYDRLAPQSFAYAARLRDAGVDVTLVPGDGLDHGFLGWGSFARRPAEVVEAIGAAVRARLGVPVTA